MKNCKRCGGEPYLLQGAVLEPTSFDGFINGYQEIVQFYQYSCSNCEYTPCGFCTTKEEAEKEWEEDNEK